MEFWNSKLKVHSRRLKIDLNTRKLYLLLLPGEGPWHDITPNKAERWRKISWAGAGGEISPPTSSQAVVYNYKSSNLARPRTLLEVPLQTKADSESVQGNPINIFQSTLDPNCRPFTPAAVRTGELNEETNQEILSELSLSLSSGLDSSLSTALSLSLSKTEDDPLPEDPKLFLPELDISHDELKETQLKAVAGQELKVHLPLVSDNSVIPPPIFPFASHWSGKSRPPLLPTPKNFPPFGPRQSETESCVEQEPVLLSPWSPATTTLSSHESLAVRKQGMVRRFSVGKTPLTPGNIGQSSDRKTYSEVLSLPNEEKEEPQEEEEEDWQPLGISWMPPSLTESHPVPDEYLVTKVIGSKLPNIKLHNCHTDLLFFLFYSFQNDLQQLVAAGLLFDRGWRYHKVDELWLARWPGLAPERKGIEMDWEEGLYQYFDVKAWKRIPGWFRLHYDKLGKYCQIFSWR